jgi:4-hydroxy-3-polyprenylbenzoate decarboxylase
MVGEEVDVTIFPAPKWHEKDGGQYIGTGTYSITRDPEENWLNAGAYRAQVHDKKTVGMVMAAGHHGRIHRDKAFKRGEPLPVVTVLGGDPLAFFFGGLEAPYGVFELDLIGGLRGRPVEMVRGKVTGLPFPANAEVVLEGYVPPDRTHPEGPFGEWTGHYAGGVRPIPVLEIKAIYYRNDPILLGVPPMGGGPDEMARYRAVMRSATIKRHQCRRARGARGLVPRGRRRPHAACGGDHAALSRACRAGRPRRGAMRRIRLRLQIHHRGG